MPECFVDSIYWELLEVRKPYSALLMESCVLLRDSKGQSIETKFGPDNILSLNWKDYAIRPSETVVFFYKNEYCFVTSSSVRDIGDKD